MVLTTEAVGVARALASADGYAVDVNREMVALGGANLLTGLSSGFVQSGAVCVERTAPGSLKKDVGGGVGGGENEAPPAMGTP